MKRVISHLAVAFVCFLTASVVVLYGYYELKTAQAVKLFLALDFNSADTIYQDLDQKINKLGVISNIAPKRWKKEIKIRKAEIKYWQRNFRALLDESSPTSDKEDSELIFLRSNSSYRNVEGERNKDKVVSGISDAITGYTATIKSDSENVKAVFNYEYLLQLRNNVARDKKQLPLKNQSRQNDRGQKPGDSQGVHGQVGRLAKESGSVPIIKIYIPLDDDEAGKEKGGQDAGKGDVQRRKG